MISRIMGRARIGTYLFALVYLASALLVVWILGQIHGMDVSRKFQLLEGICILAIWYAACRIPSLQRVLAAAPRRYLAFLAVIFWFLLVGQLTHKSRLTFPFQSFDMYSSQYSNLVRKGPAFVEMRGRTAEGNRVPFSPSTIYFALSHHNRVSNFLIRKAERAARPPSPQLAADREAWKTVCESMLAAYNRRHPTRQIVALETDYVTFPADPTWPLEDAATRHNLGVFPADPATLKHSPEREKP